MRGRKPKPISMHIAAGNPAKIDIEARKAAEPQAASGEPPRPDWLSPEASANWEYLADHLAEMGTLAQSDGIGLAMLAQQFKIWEHAQKQVDLNGSVVEAHGQQIPNPYLSIANKQATLITKLLSEFNLTPVGRARMGSIAPKPKDSGDGGVLGFIGTKVG